MTDNPALGPASILYGATEDSAEAPEVAEIEPSTEKTDEESEDVAFEYGDRVIPLSEIREWEQAHKDRKSQQADYTRKTTALAERVKDEAKKAAAERLAAFEKKASELEEKAAAFESILNANDSEFEELRYLDREGFSKESQRRMKAAIESASEARKQAEIAKVYDEQQALLNSDPEYVKDGQLSDKWQADVKLITEYAKEAGITDEEFGGIKSHRIIRALIEAKKYRDLMAKTSTAAPDKTAPKLVKPTSKSTGNKRSLTPGEIMYGAGA